ncbi:MAG: hypothetical protein N2053_02500, partial [Chitinispirillaceae bacterium]|nr:hypothetical protein [Chitinispirillaceae bacterium]
SSQFTLGIIFFCLAISLLSPLNINLIFFLFFVGAILAATNDIAIDGYYIDVLDKSEQSRFVGYRVMAYRIAMIFGTGVIATIGTRYGWFKAFLLSCLLMILIGVFHFLFAPNSKRGLPLINLIKIHSRMFIFTISFLCLFSLTLLLKKEQFFKSCQFSFFMSPIFAAMVGIFLFIFLISVYLLRNKIINYYKDKFYLNAFITFIEQEHIFLIIGFIVFLRAGEFLLTSMLSPFIVDLGLKNHYGWMQSFVGLPASIFGAITGGYLISRYALNRVAITFLLAQNGTNLLYMLIAFLFENFITTNTGNNTPLYIGLVNHIFVLLVLAFDQFAGGLGTSLLISLLMRICKEEYRASHYAIGSGLMNITSLVTGVSSGFLAKQFGYSLFFGISFLCSLPGMIFAWLIIKKLFTSDIKE